jgi:hypothetical protein
MMRSDVSGNHSPILSSAPFRVGGGRACCRTSCPLKDGHQTGQKLGRDGVG